MNFTGNKLHLMKQSFVQCNSRYGLQQFKIITKKEERTSNSNACEFFSFTNIRIQV
jgi:hypothetical protein